MDTRGEMRTPVHGNHASLVDHLVIDYDETWGLENLVTGAVPTRKDSPRHPARDTPLPGRLIFPRVGEVCQRVVLFCSGLRSDGNPAIFWLHNHRLASSISRSAGRTVAQIEIPGARLIPGRKPHPQRR